MNITPWTVYFWQQAETFRTISIITAGLIGTALAIVCVFYGCGIVDKDSNLVAALKKPKKYLTVIFAATMLAALLIPRSNTIAMMYVLPEIANSKVVQQDLPEIYDAAMKALKEQLKP